MGMSSSQQSNDQMREALRILWNAVGDPTEILTDGMLIVETINEDMEPAVSVITSLEERPWAVAGLLVTAAVQAVGDLRGMLNTIPGDDGKLQEDEEETDG